MYLSPDSVVTALSISSWVISLLLIFKAISVSWVMLGEFSEAIAVCLLELPKIELSSNNKLKPAITPKLSKISRMDRCFPLLTVFNAIICFLSP